ncbi:hypothetical protein SOVF_010190 isoform A [Spinacia oleracea]|nr:hypothetical protein SOVF_010190 isoform A [Spinacia oleracea]
MRILLKLVSTKFLCRLFKVAGGSMPGLVQLVQEESRHRHRHRATWQLVKLQRLSPFLYSALVVAACGGLGNAGGGAAEETVVEWDRALAVAGWSMLARKMED